MMKYRLIVALVAFILALQGLWLTQQPLLTVQEQQQQEGNTTTVHKPTYFTNQVPLTVLLHRGNVANLHMGCHICSWVYEGYLSNYRSLNDCFFSLKKQKYDLKSLNTSRMQPWDTVYVPIYKLDHFLNNTLQSINVPFVLFSSQGNKVNPPATNVVSEILDYPFLQAWFLNNIPTFAQQLKDHPKLHPWPYGIHWLDHIRLLPEMMKAFNGSNVTKTTAIYIGYLSKRNNRSKRLWVPMSEKVPQHVFYSQLHTSHYVLAPDGDRPECYRHYEGLALGAVPITQLDDRYYHHLPVLFNNHEWNVTKLQQKLPSQPPTVNRRTVFAEFWMEYAEQRLQHKLQWWDPVAERYSTLDEIVERVQASMTQPLNLSSELNLTRMIFCSNC
jgi:hypothetical protein